MYLVSKPSVGGNLFLRFFDCILGDDLGLCLARHRVG
jgi:hypothetical protein